MKWFYLRVLSTIKSKLIVDYFSLISHSKYEELKWIVEDDHSKRYINV